jgi:hypothetical protein
MPGNGREEVKSESLPQPPPVRGGFEGDENI